MFDARKVANNLVNSDPSIQQDQTKQDMIQTIQNGDQNRGEFLARKICERNGVSIEEALEKAKRFFGIR